MRWIYFKTIPKLLNWLVLIALVFLFLLNKFSKLFEHGEALKIIFGGILGSIIASYLFYLIVVHFKSVSDKQIIYPHIIKWAKIIIKNAEAQLNAFAKESGAQLLLENITKESIQDAFRNINPYDEKAPLVFFNKKRANWLQYMEERRNHSRRYISKIMSQLIFLDAPLVNIITKIDDSAHFLTVDRLTSIPFRNTDMGAFASAFFDYCLACRELDNYLQNHIQCVKTK